MKYCLIIDRPLVDEKTLCLELESKQDAAEFVAAMITLEALANPSFAVEQFSGHPDDPELYVVTTTGTFRAYPKGE